MKICPTCRQTYTDNSLSFCLNDGSVLNPVSGNDNQPTVYLEQPRQTNNQVNNPTNQPNNWNIPPNAAPRKKSRAWMWVVGVVGGVIVLMIVGFIGLIGLALTIGNTNTNTSNTIKYNSNIFLANSNRTPSVSSPADTRNSGAAQTDDFSGWRREVNAMGSSDYKDGEFIASSKLESNYYILATRNSGFITSNATTKLTVRNVDNKSSRYGFGLVVKINPTNSSRYAFLIDTVRQSYRVVVHTNNKENTVVNWTKSTAIRTGSEKNELEVKDENGAMKFSINGQSITTVRDATDLKDGLAGIYTSGAVPIAFSNLQIEK